MSLHRKSGIALLVAAAAFFAAEMQVSGQARLKKPPIVVHTKPMPEVTAQTNCANVPALPDIFLEQVFVAGDSPTQGARPNQNFQVTALLENRGQCETGPFIMRIFAKIQDLEARNEETKVLCDQLVQSIQPTRGRTPSYIHVKCRFQTPGTIYSGYYTFFGTADPDNKVNEFNESNNSTVGLQYLKDNIITVVRE